MGFLFDYLRLVLFAVGMLVGVQIPAVVDQYAKRVDAQLIQAQASMEGFSRTAEAFFDGDIKQLIAHYRASQDQVFRADADNLASIYQQVLFLKEEREALQGSSLARAFHVLFSHQTDIMQQTLQQYSYAVLLKPEALVWAITCGLLMAMLVELLLRVLWKLTRKHTLERVAPKFN